MVSGLDELLEREMRLWYQGNDGWSVLDIFFFCSYVFFHLMCVRDPSRRGLVCAVVGCSQRVEATWASDSWLPFSIEE